MDTSDRIILLFLLLVCGVLVVFGMVGISNQQERYEDIKNGKLERCDEFSDVRHLPPACLKRYIVQPVKN